MFNVRLIELLLLYGCYCCRCCCFLLSSKAVILPCSACGGNESRRHGKRLPSHEGKRSTEAEQGVCLSRYPSVFRGEARVGALHNIQLPYIALASECLVSHDPGARESSESGPWSQRELRVTTLELRESSESGPWSQRELRVRQSSSCIWSHI